MNTYNEIEYIKQEYIAQGILNKDGSKRELDFDYTIYPWEDGYISKCSVCKSMTIKDGKVVALHRTCGCLWFRWFKEKLLAGNPKITFV